MIFFSIFLALVIDHFWPMRMSNPVPRAICALANRIETRFNAGHPRHGRIGWFVLVLGLVLPVLIIYWFCLFMNGILVLLFNTLILYLCMGFRDYSQHFSAIQVALIVGDEPQARKLLAEWDEQNTDTLETPEIARLSIERALLTSHQRVFGVFFWFMIPFIGPSGAVLYRVASYLAMAWAENRDAPYENFGKFASRVFFWIDWIPARLTAVCFAVVGNFEDAVYAWRNFANRWENENLGVLLSAGGGALGVRLGTPVEKAIRVVPVDIGGINSEQLEAESQPGEEPALRFLQNAIALIWRALLLWLLLFLFFAIIAWLL